MAFLMVFIIAILPFAVLYLIAVQAKQEENKKKYLDGNYNTRRVEVKKQNNDISYRDIHKQALEKHIEKGCHCSFCGAKLYKGERRCSLCGSRIR